MEREEVEGDRVGGWVVVMSSEATQTGSHFFWGGGEGGSSRVSLYLDMSLFLLGRRRVRGMPATDLEVIRTVLCGVEKC